MNIIYINSNDLFRSNLGVNYPYDFGSMASVTSSSAGGNYYYFYYDIEVEIPCIIMPSEVNDQEINKDNKSNRTILIGFTCIYIYIIYLNFLY